MIRVEIFLIIRYNFFGFLVLGVEMVFFFLFDGFVKLGFLVILFRRRS